MTDPQTNRYAHGRKPVPMARPERKRRTWPMVTAIVLVVALVGGVVGWSVFGDRIARALGWEQVKDYVGEGTGEVLVTVREGETAWGLADELASLDVVASPQSFRDAAVAAVPEPVLIPGTYRLALRMSAEAALAAVTNPANLVVNSVLIHEGISYHKVLDRLAQATGIPREEFAEAAKDLQGLGLPSQAPTVEGYLFPAKYEFAPHLSAAEILQVMVNRTYQSLDRAGVAEKDRHKVLTMASVIQREAGSRKEDFYKVSRVFKNRIDQGWKLESDATVSYGTGRTDSVWTTDAERADKSNKYNTYANAGLPIGPIGAAGDLAIDAALHPVKGKWMYFVPVNLKTGETKFSVTLSEHLAGVDQLRRWCAASSENAKYCA